MKYRVKRGTRYPVAERSLPEKRESVQFDKKGGQRSSISQALNCHCRLHPIPYCMWLLIIFDCLAFTWMHDQTESRDTTEVNIVCRNRLKLQNTFLVEVSLPRRNWIWDSANKSLSNKLWNMFRFPRSFISEKIDLEHLWNTHELDKFLVGRDCRQIDTYTYD